MSSRPDADDPEIALPVRTIDGINRARRHLGAPGTWFTGAERVAMLGAARAAIAGGAPSTEPWGPIAHRVAAEAHTIDQTVVDDAAAAIGIAPYVELVGVISKGVAIDTTIRGVGIDELPLPEPEPGAPSRAEVPGAKKRSAFVPIDGPAYPPAALSLVAAESSALEDLHDTLYLSYPEMADQTIVKGLPRHRLELVAARTSLINDCFY